ncbi:MAG TPA: hypothetical protein VM388_12075 [Acidimicrobiales bacterium]|nr:hypothetical protein [Acidimicrobiales bacterium]
MPRLHKTLAAIAALTLVVLAGCSGGGDDDDAAPTTAAAGAGGPTTTVRPVDTSFSGQNSAQFCALARTYSERANAFGSNPTPAQLRTATREGQTAITQAVNAAPAEIKPDVEVLARAFTAILAELEKVNFEPARMPPAALQPLQTPEFQQSTTRFQAYGRSVCGIN